MKQYVLNKFYDVGLAVFIADLEYTENFTRVLLFVTLSKCLSTKTFYPFWGFQGVQKWNTDLKWVNDKVKFMISKIYKLPINDQRTSSYRNQSMICIANQLTGLYIMGNIGRWWVNSICQIFRLSMHELDTVYLLPFLSQDKSNKSIYPIKELANEFII